MPEEEEEVIQMMLSGRADEVVAEIDRFIASGYPLADVLDVLRLVREELDVRMEAVRKDLARLDDL